MREEKKKNIPGIPQLSFEAYAIQIPASWCFHQPFQKKNRAILREIDVCVQLNHSTTQSVLFWANLARGKGEERSPQLEEQPKFQLTEAQTY